MTPLTMTRRIAVGIAAGAIGIATLSGCGTLRDAAGGAAVEGSSAANEVLVANEQALEATGLLPADVTGEAAPSTGPSDGASADPDARHRAMRVRAYFRHHTMHGEFAVQTKDGTKTIAVQRGTITAVDGKTVTIKSSDGYSVTWTITDDTRIRANRDKGDAADLKTGAQVGVAGSKDGDTTTARLIVVPAKQAPGK